MKFLTALAAVVALVATPAAAAPSRSAATYAVINGNEEGVVFVPNSSEINAGRVTVWSGFFMHDRIMDGLKGYDVVWLLSEYDCANNTARVMMTGVEDFEGDGGFVVVEKNPEAVQKVKEGTPNAAVLGLACQRTEARFITSKELAEGLIVYRSKSKAELTR